MHVLVKQWRNQLPRKHNERGDNLVASRPGSLPVDTRGLARQDHQAKYSDVTQLGYGVWA